MRTFYIIISEGNYAIFYEVQQLSFVCDTLYDVEGLFQSSSGLIEYFGCFCIVLLKSTDYLLYKR